MTTVVENLERGLASLGKERTFCAFGTAADGSAISSTTQRDLAEAVDRCCVAALVEATGCYGEIPSLYYGVADQPRLVGTPEAKFLVEGAGIPSLSELCNFNNSHSHEDVVDAWRRAIDLARAAEGVPA